jgi:hypothetical protein
MTELANIFKRFQGSWTPQELENRMKAVRREAFGILSPETKLRDLYILADRQGWLTPAGSGRYRILVKPRRPRGRGRDLSRRSPATV